MCVCSESAWYRQSWPKCVGQSVFFPNCCSFRSLPPSPPMQCWTTGRQAFPYEQHCMGGGGGGEVGFGPKNVGFHVKNWSMVEAVHSASLSHIILARIVWMWIVNIKVRVTSILTNVWMSNLTWLMFVTFCICSIQMWLFEEKFKRFTELHERILGYGARFGRAEIWSK